MCGFSFLNLKTDLLGVAMAITRAKTALKANKCITQNLPMHNIYILMSQRGSYLLKASFMVSCSRENCVFHVLQDLCLQ